MKDIRLDVKYIDVNTLKEADYNPRKLKEKERKQIIDSISKFGFVDPVIVNSNEERKNIIIGGHQRCKVAREDLGYTEVPCVFVDLTLEQEKELNVRLNKNTGSFDNDKLQLNFTKEFLKDIGFEESELSFFISEFEKKFNSITNKDAEMPLVPKFSEKYDAVIIVSKNTIDTKFLETALSIGTAHSYKNSRTGKAMIIDVEHFKKAIYGSED